MERNHKILAIVLVLAFLFLFFEIQGAVKKTVLLAQLSNQIPFTDNPLSDKTLDLVSPIPSIVSQNLNYYSSRDINFSEDCKIGFSKLSVYSCIFSLGWPIEVRNSCLSALSAEYMFVADVFNSPNFLIGLGLYPDY